ncbi:hypothetical protein MACH07_22050 [Flagellimonas marinaquae]|uniref:Uncharacterized protein n=1 Tax=Flagellimonas marinaquae TaxID=254955 RepID=A0AA48HJF4_9FLAO|nr:hypothetical protein MACH07_22050 [Allomuricauda aquimarina]
MLVYNFTGGKLYGAPSAKQTFLTYGHEQLWQHGTYERNSTEWCYMVLAEWWFGNQHI